MRGSFSNPINYYTADPRTADICNVSIAQSLMTLKVNRKVSNLTASIVQASLYRIRLVGKWLWGRVKAIFSVIAKIFSIKACSYGVPALVNIWKLPSNISGRPWKILKKVDMTLILQSSRRAKHAVSFLEPWRKTWQKSWYVYTLKAFFIWQDSKPFHELQRLHAATEHVLTLIRGIKWLISYKNISLSLFTGDLSEASCLVWGTSKKHKIAWIPSKLMIGQFELFWVWTASARGFNVDNVTNTFWGTQCS